MRRVDILDIPGLGQLFPGLDSYSRVGLYPRGFTWVCTTILTVLTPFSPFWPCSPLLKPLFLAAWMCQNWPKDEKLAHYW